jgi:hypothetical protein
VLTGLPGLLQPWGIILLAAIAAGMYFVAFRWHRADLSRPKLHLDVAAFALLALLTGGFFWRALTEAGVFMPAGGGDLASFYYPSYEFAAQQIKSGSIPLWNPHVFSGMPFAADVQAGLFYPLNWILYSFFSIDYGALEWLLIAHYWLASAFTYVFLRDVGLSRLGALAGGVVFAFCGFMVAHLGHLPMVLVAAWIPLILLMLRRAMLNRTLAGWAWAIGAGLVMAVSLLAGHVQIFSYGLMAAGALWLYLLLGQKPLSVRSITPWVLKGGLALALALGIGAIQLLPSLRLSAESVRAAVSYEEASQFANQPITWVNFILPRVFGSNPANYFPGEWQNTENWGYTGVVTLALAAAGLAFKRGRLVGFFAVLVALALAIMVGDLSIVGAWIYKFAPGFSSLRSSGRALVLLGLGLAGLAAYGLDALVASLSKREKERQNVFWWLVGLSAVLVVLALGVMPAFYKEAIIGGGTEYGRLPGAINELGMLLLWLGLLAGVGWAAYRGRLDAMAAGGVMLALLVLDLFSPNSRFNPTTTNILAGFENYSAISVLFKGTQDERTNIPLRINSDTNAQDVWQPSTGLRSGVLYDTGGAFNPLKLERYDYLWEIAKRNPETPLYDLTGAAFEIISPTTTITPAHAGELKWELVDKFEGFDIYRNKNALPRAFLVHESRVLQKAESIVLELRRFDVDPRHIVILESGTPTQSDLPGTAEGQSTGEFVRATRYSPNEIDLTVKANAPGWVVLTDAWYPGWEVKINGQPGSMEPAFYAYRAIRVGAGEQTISMRFEPNNWRVGRVVTLLALVVALVGLGVILFLMRRGRRRAA